MLMWLALLQLTTVEAPQGDIALDVPIDDARRLGHELAAGGVVATLVPMLAEKDLVDLAAEDQSLTGSEREQLLVLGRARAKAGLDHLLSALGDAYATSLSGSEMRILIEQNASPARQHWLAIQPASIQQAVAALEGLDLKKDTAAEFCGRTGKLCDRD